MVISAYNEEKVIEKKLENCLNIDYPSDKIEFIIGSDGSDDRTVELVKSWPQPNIHLIDFKSQRGKACVLNDIIPNTTGDLLCFSDANTLYHADAIKNLIRHFHDSKVGGVCGKLVLHAPNQKKVHKEEAQYWNFENRIKKLEGKIKTVFGATGGIYIIRKKLWQPLPDHTMINDDFLTAIRVIKQKYNVLYDEEAIAMEYTASDIKGEFNRKIRIGAANYKVISYLLPLLNPFRGFVAFGLWSHKIIRWFVPFFLIALLITNLFLLDSIIYQITLALQLSLYLFGILGFILDLRSITMPVFSYPFYFFAMNIAFIFGFFRCLFNRQRPAWSRTERH